MIEEVMDASGWKVRKYVGNESDAPTVAQLAWEKAKLVPDRLACYFEDEPPVSYKSIVAETASLCESLTRLGLVSGDTVSFQLPNWREAVVINLAAAALGLIVNPISPIYRGAELRFLLTDARSKLLFIPSKYRSTDHERLIEA